MAAPQAADSLPRDRFSWCGESLAYWAGRRPGTAALSDSTGAVLSYRDLETTPAYYYVRVWQSPGEWAWTSPIWVDRD